MSLVIDKKLFATLDQLNDKQKREVLVFAGHFLAEDERGNNKWEDDNFVSEMGSRYNHYKNGGQMITTTEADKRIKQILETGRK